MTSHPVPENQKLGTFIGNIPVLNWSGKLMRHFSGVTPLYEAVKAAPNNPYRHFRLAEQFDQLDKVRKRWSFGVNAWRLNEVRRGHWHAVVLSYAVRTAIKAAVRVVDGPAQNPRIIFYRNAALISFRLLQENPDDDGLLLLLGAASLRLAIYGGEYGWLRRAERAFMLVLLTSTNRYIVSDAAQGLACTYARMPSSSEQSARYTSLARRLGADLSGQDPSRPSLWTASHSDPRSHQKNGAIAAIEPNPGALLIRKITTVNRDLRRAFVLQVYRVDLTGETYQVTGTLYSFVFEEQGVGYQQLVPKPANWIRIHSVERKTDSNRVHAAIAEASTDINEYSKAEMLNPSDIKDFQQLMPKDLS